MTRGASIAVFITMSLMLSFDGHKASPAGPFDAIAAGPKVVASTRPRITAPPIPSLPPLTSLTTQKPKNTNNSSKQSAKPPVVLPRPTGAPTQKPQTTRKTLAPPTSKTSQFQRPQFLPVAPASQFQRQPPQRPAVSLPTAPRTTLKPTLSSTKSNPKPAPKATPRFPSTAPAPNKPTQRQPPTVTQRPSVLAAPPLPKLPPTRPATQVTTSTVTTTTKRPTPPTISRSRSYQPDLSPDQVSNSRPIQASTSSGLLQSPDIYVINGRQLKQYKVYEEIDNDIEQDLSSFVPANLFLTGYNARVRDDLQLRSRFGGQRSQQIIQPPGLPTPNSIALGSGGLGFVKLPNGDVYLGSGSLGYISGLQRSLDVVDARTRTGAAAPDATHFGHGPLSDSFYYGSD